MSRITADDVGGSTRNALWQNGPLSSAAHVHMNASADSSVEPELRVSLKQRIRDQLRARNAVLVAHYYVDGELQDLALETGGCVADSLEMARFGRDHAAKTLVVAGVRFMGETAKILSPDKRVLMPDLDATCSLDLGCPPEQFAAFLRRAPRPHRGGLRQHQRGREGARRLDGDELVRGRDRAPPASAGQKILWAPDRHLGRYIQQQTGADMLLWDGACIVHDEFKGLELELMRREHPEARRAGAPRVAAQRGGPGRCRRLDLATAQGRGRTALRTTYIVATDNGILHRMRQLAPGKTLIEAPTAGQSATCKSCAHCPWMAMNGLQGVLDCLLHGHGEIEVTEPVRGQALSCIERMLDFVAAHPAAMATASTRLRAEDRRGLTRHMFDSNENLAQARERNIRDALFEDIGRGDWTGQLVPAGRRVHARVIVREAPCWPAATGSTASCTRSTRMRASTGMATKAPTWQPTPWSARSRPTRAPCSRPNGPR